MFGFPSVVWLGCGLAVRLPVCCRATALCLAVAKVCTLYFVLQEFILQDFSLQQPETFPVTKRFMCVSALRHTERAYEAA